MIMVFKLKLPPYFYDTYRYRCLIGQLVSKQTILASPPLHNIQTPTSARTVENIKARHVLRPITLPLYFTAAVVSARATMPSTENSQSLTTVADTDLFLL